MHVLKRNGRKETVHFDKITSRIRHLCYGLDPKYVDPVIISQKVIMGVYPGVTTTELDELAAQTAASFATKHPDFSRLAARISVSNLHKMSDENFSDVVEKFYRYVHPKTNKPAPLVSQAFYECVMRNKERLDGAVVHARDFEYDYFGFKTLEKSYLLKLHGKIAERPQQMLMRVAVGIHMGYKNEDSSVKVEEDVDAMLETYDMLSLKYFTHATPTLFNAGAPNPQMSSCFLLAMKEDSIDGIYDTLKQCAVISKYAGGIGLSIHNIRASQSYISGTNGTSNGIVPMLRVFNNTARYVDQGGGKRKGSIAIYLETWHADIFQFLDLRKNHGNESDRARDLFYALWISDLFMKRVQANAMWSLFCPNEAPGLADCHGAEFDALYTKYEAQGLARKSVKAQTLWFAILDSQVETGTPYMLFKDACNSKSNQKNLGTIKSSNLCTEILEYTSKDEVAVCNLGSINLSKFVNKEKRSFDFEDLVRCTRVLARNLNKVIDLNYYPVVEAKNSNFRHRPIGIGVQGLADCFQLLHIPFTSEKAKKLNIDIFESIYYGAVTTSIQLAKELGTYSSYEGSPASEGKLQFDLWGVTPGDRYDWSEVKKNLAEHGLRNSLLVAPMPTASTAQILGNNESVEPFTSNMYNRRVLAGEFTVVNKHLLRLLNEKGLWTEKVRNRIIADGGSVQNVPDIPDDIKEVYKTVWEIPQRFILDMAADRAPFICQSQSLNVHIAEPTTGKLTSMHFYAWKKGLKTGMYYLRTRPKADAIQFTVNKEDLVVPMNNRNGEIKDGDEKKNVEDEEECLNCGA